MNEKISYRDLVGQISGRTDKSRQFTLEFMRGLVSVIESGLETGGSVSISGFGKFERRWMKQRKGIHPGTGQEMIIPGQNKIVFKPYKPLREHVNRSFLHMAPEIPGKTRQVSPSPDLTASLPETGPGQHRNTETATDLSGASPDIEKPAHSGASFIEAFFIEYDEEAAKGETTDELLIERPSPVAVEKPDLSIADEPFRTGRSGGVETPPDLTAKKNDSGTEKSLPADSYEKRRGFIRLRAAAAVTVLLLLTAILFVFVVREDSAVTDGISSNSTRPDPLIEEFSSGSVEESGLMIILIGNGQTLWELAQNYLGDSYLWPWIFYLNRDTINNPNVITAGTNLVIPVPAYDESLSDDELKEVAAGYITVYNWYKEQDAVNARHFLWAAGSFYPELLDDVTQQVDDTDLRFARNR
ncbi:MAG: HU family DNA-binding protein [Balneolaceae bacterium]